MEHRIANDYTSSTQTGQDHIKVFVRARPPADGSTPPSEMWKNNDGKLSILGEGRVEHHFLFDQVFWVESNQELIFNEVAKPLVDHSLEGFNGCVFAYGQTGSGKTYSIFGEGGEKRGLISRSVEYVFERLQNVSQNKEVAVVVSFLEMYCDEIRDLGKAYLDKKARPESASKQKTAEWYLQKLHRARSRVFVGSSSGYTENAPDEGAQSLTIHEDQDGNVFVRDLSLIPVSTPEEVIAVVQSGFKLRATHETKMNKYSSRSHTVFTMTILQKDTGTGETRSGMINLVDLAGSERLRRSESEGQRLREALSINTSLSALGKVTMALDPSLPAAYVPYRDSKLTRLLQNSLGGNSHTSVVTTLHPTRDNYEECLNALQFANQCRNVINQPRVNYVDTDGRGTAARIKRLLAEIRRLKHMISAIVAKKNRQLAEVLAELGVRGKVLGDGRVELSNGRVVGSAVDMKTLEQEATKAAASSGANGGDSGGVGGAIGGALDPLAQADGGAIQIDLAAMRRHGVAGSGTATSRSNFDSVRSGHEATTEEVRRLRAKHSAERAECRRLRGKLAKSKSELKAARAAVAEERSRASAEAKESRLALSGLQREMKSSAHNARTAVERSAKAHQAELRQVLLHAGTVRNEQAAMLAAMPEELDVASQKLRLQRDEVAEVRDRLAREHREHLQVLRESKAKEMAAMQQQAKYWMDEKDAEQRRLLAEAHRFHEQVEAERSERTRELEMLYEHCIKLTRVLDRMERGEYPIRQAGTTSKVETPLRSLCIPGSHKPDPNLLHDPRRLKLLAQQIASLDRYELAARRQKPHAPETPETFSGQQHVLDDGPRRMPPNSARGRLQAARAAYDGGKNEGNDYTNVASTRKENDGKPPLRPRSAAAAVPQRQRAVWEGGRSRMASKSRTSPVEEGTEGVEGENGSEDDDDAWVSNDDGDVEDDALSGVLSTGTSTTRPRSAASALATIDVKSLSVGELREFVVSLQQERAPLRSQVEAEVLGALSEHPTVSYIKAVEDEAIRYKASLEDEIKRHKQLRVAFTSQQRLIAKREAKHRVSSASLRPRSAVMRSGSSRPASGRIRPRSAMVRSASGPVLHGHRK